MSLKDENILEVEKSVTVKEILHSIITVMKYLQEENYESYFIKFHLMSSALSQLTLQNHFLTSLVISPNCGEHFTHYKPQYFVLVCDKLTNLKKLSISHYGSDLKEIPSTIARLQNLEELDLSFNRIEHIPWTLKWCKKLRVLRLNENCLSYIPFFIINLPNLELLCRKTETIPLPRTDISQNYSTLRITTLPDISTSKASAPPSLERLSACVLASSQHDLPIPRLSHHTEIFCEATKHAALCASCDALYDKQWQWKVDNFSKQIIIPEWNGHILLFLEAFCCSKTCSESFDSYVKENEVFKVIKPPVFVDDDRSPQQISARTISSPKLSKFHPSRALRMLDRCFHV